MKTKFYVGFLVLLGAGCGSYSNKGGYGGGGGSGAVTVTIPASAAGKGAAAYGTNPLHVALGSTVTWYNSDAMAHTATSDTAVWDTGSISAGGYSAPVTFGTAGTYSYHCSIHGAVSMSGVIIVP